MKNLLANFGIGKKEQYKFNKCPDCGVKKGQLHKKGCDLGSINNYHKKFSGELK